MSFEEYSSVYNVQSEIYCLKYSDYAIAHIEYNGKSYGWLSPQLYMLAKYYGEKNIIYWIDTHLRGIVMMSGAKADQTTAVQIKNLAQVILYEHPTLTNTEFMLFCQRFKAGKYGTFYGTIDPMKIGESLFLFREWVKQRREELFNQIKKLQ